MTLMDAWLDGLWIVVMWLMYGLQGWPCAKFSFASWTSNSQMSLALKKCHASENLSGFEVNFKQKLHLNPI